MNRYLNLYNYSREDLYVAYIEYDMSLDELSKAIGCSNSRLRWYLNELGIKKNNRCCQDTEVMNQIIDRYVNKKMSCEEIGKIYGCHWSTVQNNLRKHKIAPRRNMISNEERKKAYKNEDFMKEVNDFFIENKWLFEIYGKMAVKYGYNYDDFLEYSTNEFYTYCVTKERLENFKKYSIRNFLKLNLKHFIYRKTVKENLTLYDLRKLEKSEEKKKDE